ncbi:MAG TPA: EAL domain-containing protein [Alphaproteobacteria bacterium]|nr:EAL domain-containing protein [Alphaproteobacteria bacterium]
MAEKADIAKLEKIKAAKAMRASSSQIWKSKLSWRIAMAAFFTILAVQIAILILTVKQEEIQILSEIKEVGRSAIAPVLENAPALQSPITEEKAQRLVSSTIVNGIAVYDAGLYLLSSHGEPVVLQQLSQENLSRSYRSADGSSYEVIYRPNDLRKPYIIVARLNSEKVDDGIISYVQQSIMVMLLLSALVTTVLMIALGHWLLEPILFMRNNLLAAQQNPDNPKIPDSPFDPNDEIGGAIVIAQKLIRQNAENMQQMRSAAEDKIHKLAYFDQLTGLPNRTLFVQKLTELAFSGGEKETVRFAVVTLDLDHFKDINDSMGHNVGDAILRGVGKRLRSSLPESAIVARAGEDEFAVTVPLNTDLNTSRDVAEKVASIIRAEPFKVYNESFQIRSSVGVATYPEDGTDPNEVLKHADIALNRAKEEGRDRIREYSEDFDRVVQQRFQLLRDLRDALEKEELTVFYQPQFDLTSGQIIGAEALIRWWKKDNSKEGGSFVSPADFIPIAEQSGLIVPIGAWVMKEACETAKKWHDAGKNIRIAVNVSSAQFFQSDLVGYTKSVLADTGVAPHLLELEVTESVFMDDISIAVDTLKRLHELGIELAIDDFGTGYSSLSYLRQFNIDRLKIDQSFIRNALTNSDDAAIAKTIIKLGHSLNLKVIAEGVETKEHESFLMEEGCDEVQGFRYSKPVPKEDFWKFAENYNGSLDSF